MALEKQARLALKKRAHALKPVVMIGQHGLTDNVLAEIDTALTAHELIKIKAAGVGKAEGALLSEKICTACNADPVQYVGRILTIFRENKE